MGQVLWQRLDEPSPKIDESNQLTILAQSVLPACPRE